MPRLDPVLTGGYGVAVVAPQGGRLVEFQVLGPFQIVREGRPVALGGYKQRALLALLLLERHRVVSHDRLVDALWGERPPPSARNSVQVYVSRLRRVLAGEGGDEELLVRQPTGYLLRAPAEAVDAERFERLLMEGVKAFHAGGAEPAEETLARALALWRGPALADFAFEPFAQGEIARLEELRLRALEERLEALLALGRHGEALGELHALVDEHPLEERLRGQLMLALYRSGRQADALAVYQDFRRLLADQLGLDPSRELRELEGRILRQEPELAAAPTVASASAAGPVLNSEGTSTDAPSATPASGEERKTVTVLVAGVIGSVEEQQDPEDVHARRAPVRRRIRQEIEQHGGTVEGFVGDTVTAVFGAPAAHEDDPERAVRAALTIREAVRECDDLHVRIGIATGAALVALRVRAKADQGTLSGNIVNTAARLEAASPLDMIVVAERTYRATREVIDYHEAEPVATAANPVPAAVWEAIQARSPLGVDVAHYARAPLVGRERELNFLEDALMRVREDRSPQLVTLVGVPGIGKSRLVYELMQAVGDDPSGIVTWRQGRSLPYGEGVSFWALAEIVKAQAGILETDAERQAQPKLARAVQALVEDVSEAEWVERHLSPLAGLGGETDLPTDRSEGFAAWRRFLEALADWRPVVLVFEDLHWADEGLLDFVDSLVEWVNDVPLLIVATARPELLERRPNWAGGKANATTLSLSALSEEETARLVRTLVEGVDLDSETERALVAHAGGNALYAEQYARMWQERGQAKELAPPETVQAIIAARLDALPPDEKSLLQNGAVFGKVFWGGAIIALNAVEPDEVSRGLHALERKEFIQRARRSSVDFESEYAFRHVLVRDVAYSQIPRGARAEKHQRAAAWIDSLGRTEDQAEMLAHHYTVAHELLVAAGTPDDDVAARAQRALGHAGDRAMALNAYPAAAGFYERALSSGTHDDHERADLLFRSAEVLHAAGDERRQRALEDAVEALLKTDSGESAAEAETLLAGVWWDRGLRDRCFAHLDCAVRLVPAQSSSPAKARVLSQVARYYMLERNFDEAITTGHEALVLANELDLPELRADILVTIGTARTFKGEDEGVAEIEEGLELALKSNALRVAVRGYNNLGSAMALHGRLAQQVLLLDEAERLSERLGDASGILGARGNKAHSAYALGRWDESLRLATEIIATLEAGSTHRSEIAARFARARIRLARDDSDGAWADAAAALEAARGIDAPELFAAISTSIRFATELGRDADAESLIEEARAMLSRQPKLGAVAYKFFWVAHRFDLADELRTIVERHAPPHAWFAKSDLALLDQDYLAAAEIYRAAGAVASEADARLRVAKALVAEARHEDAEAQLEQALDFYRSVRATRYIREAEALLAAIQSESKAPAAQPRA